MTNFTYKKLSKKDLNLLLKKSKKIDINDYWLAGSGSTTYVLYAKKEMVAIFNTFNVQDQYTKTLDIKVLKNKEQFTTKYLEYIIEIFYFIFKTIIKITKDKDIKKCKIYSDTNIMSLVFYEFAKQLNQDHNTIIKYKKWIEVEFKGEKK